MTALRSRLPAGRRLGAIGASRLARSGARLAGHRGSALPGLVAERLDPNVVASLAAQLGPVVLVVGSNGKTTTARLLSRILEAAFGMPPITNRSGANMRQGIASTLVEAARLDGRLERPGAPAVFEVDEMALASVSGTFPPAAVVATNLFRDQLDRYGEVEMILARWDRALSTVRDKTTLVYCADDPRLEQLRHSTGIRSVSFGLDRDSAVDPADAGQTSDADPVSCPVCGAAYVFTWRSIAHLGDFCCPNGHLRRAQPDVRVRIEREEGQRGLGLRFSGAFGSHAAEVQLAGLSGAYNTAAAVATAISLDVEAGAAVRAVDGATPAFGRLEQLEVDGRQVIVMLIKNAASLSESQRAVQRIEPDSILLGLNDAPADGQDVSWIWDADLRPLEGATAVGVTGTRADDLALRLKYAPRGDGADWPLVTVQPVLEAAFMTLVERTPLGGTLCVLATYTAMLGIRGILEDLGVATKRPR